MTYREYMDNHEDENLSWCRPYTDKSGDHSMVICDGEILCITAPDYEGWRYDGTLTDGMLERFAREVNPDYDLFGAGWTDMDKALNAMHEVGCAHCPWRDECEAMGEEMEEE